MAPTLLVVILIGVLGGVAIGIQDPIVSLIAQRMGTLESAFIAHLSGAVIALIPLVLRGGGNLANWRVLPWYAFVSGILGVMLVASVTVVIPRLGVSAAAVLIIAGQLISSALIDHFGWFGIEVRSMDSMRLLGLLVVAVGAWMTVRRA